jgi:hypothetical protein
MTGQWLNRSLNNWYLSVLSAARPATGRESGLKCGRVASRHTLASFAAVLLCMSLVGCGSAPTKAALTTTPASSASSIRPVTNISVGASTTTGASSSIPASTNSATPLPVDAARSAVTAIFAGGGVAPGDVRPSDSFAINLPSCPFGTVADLTKAAPAVYSADLADLKERPPRLNRMKGDVLSGLLCRYDTTIGNGKPVSIAVIVNAEAGTISSTDKFPPHQVRSALGGKLYYKVETGDPNAESALWAAARFEVAIYVEGSQDFGSGGGGDELGSWLEALVPGVINRLASLHPADFPLKSASSDGDISQPG